jgi:hypothetical protein
MSNTSEVKISNGTGTFKFVKDTNTYSTYWVCVSGQCPGTFGRHTTGMIVPRMFRADLRKIAREAGYSDEDLASPVKPERVKASGGPRTARVSTKKTGIRISLRDRIRARKSKVAPETEEN